MSTVLSGFDSAYWNLAQVIAWVYLGDRKLVDDLGGSDTAPNRWTEVKLPDGSTEVAETSAPRPPSLRIDIIAASRGAGTMSPVPSPLRQHNPGGFEPAVPAPRSKRFISAFASRDDAEVDILRRLQDGTVPLSGKRRGRGLREIIPILQLLDATIDCDGNRITTKKGEWWGDVFNREEHRFSALAVRVVAGNRTGTNEVIWMEDCAVAIIKHVRCAIARRCPDAREIPREVQG